METSPSPSRKRSKSRNEEPEPSETKYDSIMVWHNLDNGLIYLINEKTGEQVECDSRGIPIKPFNPKITGRYNYEDRKKAIIKSKADCGPVDLP